MFFSLEGESILAKEKNNTSKNPSNKSSSKTNAKYSTKNKTLQPKDKIKKTSTKPLPWPDNILALTKSGAVIVVDENNNILFSHNAEKMYVPASILKILISGAALELLGPDYRFQTKFYLDNSNNLWIVGLGDPFLVPEELAVITDTLLAKKVNHINNIYLDNSFFQENLILDGNSATLNPYDAFNSALAVNFNTVGYKKTKKGDIYPIGDGTPLTPTAIKLARQIKSVGENRLNIADSLQTAIYHTGEVFEAFLKNKGIRITGSIITGKKKPVKAKLIYTHYSSKDLEEIVVSLLKYSNNFITNQIFLTMGAELYGQPATVEKSQKAINKYLKNHNINIATIVEGSGLSRKNKISAKQMAQVLKIFELNRYLLNSKYNDKVLLKTGTMTNIQTLAGYIENPKNLDENIRFVILLNGSYPYGTRDKILDIIINRFAK